MVHGHQMKQTLSKWILETLKTTQLTSSTLHLVLETVLLIIVVDHVPLVVLIVCAISSISKNLVV